MDLKLELQGRYSEILSYLELLDAIDSETKAGAPRLGNHNGYQISTQQIKMLYSSVYLQCYNLVESTITNCIEVICQAIVSENALPKNLNTKLQYEWVRFVAKTNIDSNAEKRQINAMKLFDHSVQMQTVANPQFKLDRGGGGNWDDKEIASFCERIGFPLNIPPQVSTLVKRHFKDDEGPLTYIKSLRNKLAHGAVSFEECAANATPGNLRQLVVLTGDYLNVVVEEIQKSIDNKVHLVP